MPSPPKVDTRPSASVWTGSTRLVPQCRPRCKRRETRIRLKSRRPLGQVLVVTLPTPWSQGRKRMVSSLLLGLRPFIRPPRLKTRMKCGNA